MHSLAVALKNLHLPTPPATRLEPAQLSQQWMLYFYLFPCSSQAHANVGDK